VAAELPRLPARQKPGSFNLDRVMESIVTPTKTATEAATKRWGNRLYRTRRNARAAHLKPTRTIRTRKKRRTKMKNRTVQRAIVAALAGFLLASMLTVTPVAAQQRRVRQCHDTLDGKQLPAPPPKFGGVIKESAKDSTPWWPPRHSAAEGRAQHPAHHDRCQGYGVSSTFGGVIRHRRWTASPTRAALHAVPFHSTLLAARAALITGRNHHSVGTGVIGELSTGFPGYTPSSERGGDHRHDLRENGYGHLVVWQNHNTPSLRKATAGPLSNGRRA